jgi:ABC-type branched-subunit amino acid transport system substrate-binding protein
LNEPSITILPIDTKGTPFGAQKAAEEAVAKGAKMILGPVFSRSAQSVASVAEKHGIGVISFSNDRALAGTGVFALGFRPEQQVERIVHFANARGIKDYAAVLPNNSYGATVAEVMRLTLKDSSSSLLRNEIYYVDRAGKARNLDQHVASALNSALTARAETDYNKKKKQFSDNPIVYPRGFLIPEGGARLTEILSYLGSTGSFDPNKIKLLGSALWLDSLENNPLLEGAWVAAAPIDKQKEFRAKFKEVYGYDPVAISSLAYDGVALSVALARMSGGMNFSRDAITNPRGFTGIDGIFRLESDGLTTRGLAIMEIQNGQAVIIDPAPHSFAETYHSAPYYE